MEIGLVAADSAAINGRNVMVILVAKVAFLDTDRLNLFHINNNNISHLFYINVGNVAENSTPRMN